MIGTVFEIALLRLWNNKQELLLALVVPILFFSIFALIFGRGVATDTAAIVAAIVDDDRSPLTQEMVRLLKEQPAIRIEYANLRTSQQWPLERLASAVIRETSTDVVVHLPRHLGQRLRTQTPAAVRLLSDGTNPVGRQIVGAVVAQVVGVASAGSSGLAGNAGQTARRGPPDRLAGRPAGEPPIQQAAAVAPARPASSVSSRLTVETTDVVGLNKRNPKIAMYAAGIAVMFLLFSATGASGTLLEEHEAGTLDRLLSSRLHVVELLLGKWLYIAALGCVQLTVMFAWAQCAFGVDLLGHLPGFAVLAVCTAAATASFAMFLAVVCRSRAQLHAVSIVLILTMSALGGSMVPRYIMSEEMRQWGELTFNAWALDGFEKVFWYDLPLTAVTTEIQLLLVIAFVFACLALLCADRWAAE